MRASYACAVPSDGLGTRTPQASPAALVSVPASGRPPELDDPRWLRARLEVDGTPAIARELGCSRKMVRAAADRLGIPPLPPGRRGRPLQVVPPAGHEHHGEMVLTGTALAILTRFQEEQRGVAAVDKTLARRVVDYAEADANGDDLAAEDALLSIASAAGLIHQHRRRLRGAA